MTETKPSHQFHNFINNNKNQTKSLVLVSQLHNHNQHQINRCIKEKIKGKDWKLIVAGFSAYVCH